LHVVHAAAGCIKTADNANTMPSSNSSSSAGIGCSAGGGRGAASLLPAGRAASSSSEHQQYVALTALASSDKAEALHDNQVSSLTAKGRRNAAATLMHITIHHAQHQCRQYYECMCATDKQNLFLLLLLALDHYHVYVAHSCSTCVFQFCPTGRHLMVLVMVLPQHQLPPFRPNTIMPAITRPTAPTIPICMIAKWQHMAGNGSKWQQTQLMHIQPV